MPKEPKEIPEPIVIPPPSEPYMEIRNAPDTSEDISKLDGLIKAGSVSHAKSSE